MSFEPVFVASCFRRPKGLRPLSLHGLCLVILLALPRVNSQCYFPNRTQNTNSDYQPCPPAAQGLASMCCATNRTSNPDTCHPNGLCEGHGEVGAGFDPEAPYYRESCTDKSWNSTYCLKLCIGAASDGSTPDVSVTDCQDGTYCCGRQNATCCAQGQGTPVASILGAAKPTISPTTSSSTATSATPLPTQSPGHSRGLSAAREAGVILGVTIGLIFIGIILGDLWLLRRKRNAKMNGRAKDPGLGLEAPNAAVPAQGKVLDQHEMTGTERKLDLHADALRSGLEGVGRPAA
ncbi:MAG: hypothetical protein FRX48_09511 [Lasallia pustulata]|uniref:Uncharacterized protein n=1 Tax=Lasallia pustulata TaxID=136370 RepID=A0A5M8PBX1_9LECA|nr:MAG: hypothetical protein FRX48_09511 [Lasallia pustulata]